MIQSVTVYETKGQQFRTFKKAVDHRENLVEKFLRTRPGFENMPNRDRIKFIQSILDNRNELIDLLTYDDKTPEDDE